MKLFSNIIPGLLQTEDYARRMLGAAAPQPSVALLEELVTIRIGRQRVLRPEKGLEPPLELHAVIDEAALQRRPDEDEMMRRQLRRLVADAELRSVHLRVFPFTAGFSPAFSTFTAFEPRDPTDTVVVNVESALQDSTMNRPMR